MQNYQNVFCDYKYPRSDLYDKNQQNEDREIAFLINRARWIFYETEK